MIRILICEEDTTPASDTLIGKIEQSSVWMWWPWSFKAYGMCVYSNVVALKREINRPVILTQESTFLSQ